AEILGQIGGMFREPVGTAGDDSPIREVRKSQSKRYRAQRIERRQSDDQDRPNGPQSGPGLQPIVPKYIVVILKIIAADDGIKRLIANKRDEPSAYGGFHGAD